MMAGVLNCTEYENGFTFHTQTKFLFSLNSEQCCTVETSFERTRIRMNSHARVDTALKRESHLGVQYIHILRHPLHKSFLDIPVLKLSEQV
jgi:hypothetical protein